MSAGRVVMTILGALALTAHPLKAGSFDKGGIFTLGARSAAMAGAAVAQGDDASCLGYNPAGLVNPEADNEVYGQYAALLGNKIVENYFSHRGFIPGVEISYGLGYLNQSSTSQYHYTEQTYLAALAVPFSDDRRLLFGTTLKLLQSGLDLPDTSALGYGLDVGFRYRPPGLGEKLGLGLSVMDFQSSLSFGNGMTESPPQMLLAGCSYQFDRDTVLEADGEQISDLQSPGRSSQGFRTGVEHWFLGKGLALRLGYSESSALAGRFAYGLGARYQEFQLDAAYLQDVNQLGDSLRVSACYRFGWPGGLKTPGRAGKGEAAALETPGQRLKLKAKIAAEPAVFTPLEGSENPLTRLKLSVEGDAAGVAGWTILIVSPQGDTVASFEGTDLPKEPPVWKGNDAQGKPLGEADYQISAVLWDGNRKEIAADRAKVKLLRQETLLEITPEYAIFAPGGMSRRPAARFSVALKGGPNAKSWVFTVRDSRRKTVKSAAGRGKPLMSLQWDGQNRAGKAAADGQYFASLEVTFKDGSKKTAEAQVEADSRRARISLKADSQIFTPRQGTLTLFPAVEQDGDLVAGWEISIENLNGLKVMSFKGAGLPDKNFPWNGLDDHGAPVAPGTLYYVNFAAVMKSGALSATPRLAVSSEIKKFEEDSAIKVPLATLTFAAGDEVIDLDQYVSLKNAADAVKKYGANYLVQVKGYCDDREAIGGAIGPLELSALRAKTVADYLVKAQGVPEARVASMGYGSNSALGSNDTDEGRKRNRRVEVILFTK